MTDIIIHWAKNTYANAEQGERAHRQWYHYSQALITAWGVTLWWEWRSGTMYPVGDDIRVGIPCPHIKLHNTHTSRTRTPTNDPHISLFLPAQHTKLARWKIPRGLFPHKGHDIMAPWHTLLHSLQAPQPKMHRISMRTSPKPGPMIKIEDLAFHGSRVDTPMGWGGDIHQDSQGRWTWTLDLYVPDNPSEHPNAWRPVPHPCRQWALGEATSIPNLFRPERVNIPDDIRTYIHDIARAHDIIYPCLIRSQSQQCYHLMDHEHPRGIAWSMEQMQSILGGTMITRNGAYCNPWYTYKKILIPYTHPRESAGSQSMHERMRLIRKYGRPTIHP